LSVRTSVKKPGFIMQRTILPRRLSFLGVTFQKRHGEAAQPTQVAGQRVFAGAAMNSRRSVAATDNAAHTKDDDVDKQVSAVARVPRVGEGFEVTTDGTDIDELSHARHPCNRRRVPAALPEVARAEVSTLVSTLRLRLWKVAALVKTSVRRIWFHFSTTWSQRTLWRRVQAALTTFVADVQAARRVGLESAAVLLG
jgi:hypothetical protein